MNWEETVRRSSVIREQHRESLIAGLRNRQDFNWLLGAPNRSFDRLQGDFFETFPVSYLDPQAQPATNRRTVMIVNNTCDLPANRSTFVSVAPVVDLGSFLKALEKRRKPEALANFEKTVRENNVCELLFLPTLKGFPNGALVRLDMICSVAMSLLEEAVRRGTRCASFTQNGFYVLLMKLTYHLTRIESDEVTRF